MGHLLLLVWWLVLYAFSPSFPAFAADLGHVLTIRADGFTTLMPGLTCFFRVEFVCVTTRMGRQTAPAGDLGALLGIQPGETA
jgi:hypothetical protein